MKGQRIFFARGNAVMRDDRERMPDIQEAIARIEKYAGRGREAFKQDGLIQTWGFTSFANYR